MVIVVNDSALGDVRELSDFELDLAYGSDENALKLEARAGEAPRRGPIRLHRRYGVRRGGRPGEL